MEYKLKLKIKVMFLIKVILNTVDKGGINEIVGELLTWQIRPFIWKWRIIDFFKQVANALVKIEIINSHLGTMKG